MITTIGKHMARGVGYFTVYGDEGCGKTSLAMTLSKDYGNNDIDRSKKGMDVAFILPEPRGATSVVQLGYSPNIKFKDLPQSEEMFAQAAAAIRQFASDPGVSAICWDNVTVMCERFIQFYTDGGTEKDMGFDGWGKILAGFRNVESECEAAIRKGKSVLVTLWSKEPKTKNTLAGGEPEIMEKGRPLLKGEAKRWIPGKTDVVARMTSHFKKVSEGGKMVDKWHGQLQVHASEEYIAKTRWPLPNPAPAHLGKLVEMIAKAGKLAE